MGEGVAISGGSSDSHYSIIVKMVTNTDMPSASHAWSCTPFGMCLWYHTKVEASNFVSA